VLVGVVKFGSIDVRGGSGKNAVCQYAQQTHTQNFSIFKTTTPTLLENHYPNSIGNLLPLLYWQSATPTTLAICYPNYIGNSLPQLHCQNNFLYISKVLPLHDPTSALVKELDTNLPKSYTYTRSKLSHTQTKRRRCNNEQFSNA
jgi:hypothetical protein